MYIPIDAILLAAFVYYIVWVILSTRNDIRKEDDQRRQDARAQRIANEQAHSSDAYYREIHGEIPTSFWSGNQ